MTAISGRDDRRSRLLALGCIAGTAATLAVGSLFAQQQRPLRGPFSFVESVDLGLVRVTVTDDEGAPLTDLEASDFALRVDGQAQEIVFLDNESERRLEVAVVIDASGSIERHVPRMRPLLREFLSALRVDDCVLMLPFSDDVGPGHWNVDVAGFVDTFALGGNTRLRDAVRSAVLALSGPAATPASWGSPHCRGRVDDRQRPKRAVVLVTDGADTASIVSFGELIETTWEQQIPIITLGVGPAAGTTPSYLAGMFRFSRDIARDLTELAGVSGGRYLPATDGDHHTEYFREILMTLRSSYLLGYRLTDLPANDAAEWRAVRVSTSRPGARVTAPEGIYVSENSPGEAAFHLRRGVEQFDAGQYFEALETFGHAADAHWESDEAHYYKALAARETGDDETARNAALWALALAPRRPEVVMLARTTGALPATAHTATPNAAPLDVWIEPASQPTIPRQQLARRLARMAAFHVQRLTEYRLIDAPRVNEPRGGLVVDIRDVGDDGDVAAELLLAIDTVRPPEEWFRVLAAEMAVRRAQRPSPPAELVEALDRLLTALRRSQR